MADTQVADRVFSEDEAYAIAADRVARETAELNQTIETLKAEKADLETKIDVEVAAREAAEQRAKAAEEAHEKFVADLEAEKAAESRKADRLAKVREAASHLPDSFFEDEARVQRIVAMDDEHFEGYLADLRETAKDAAPRTTENDPPRETAMQGDKVAPKAGGSAREFLMRSYVAPKEA